jgi:hypothetical protein
MEKKIASLLNNNLRVIIPDFGAFIIRQQEPRIVVFNEFLKNNDGLLLDHIMKTENVECDVAQQLLSDYTSHAVRTLDSGGILTIEGIGKLKKDKKGMIVFSTENEILNLEEPEPLRQTVTEDQLPFDKAQVAESYSERSSFFLKTFLNKQVVRWAAVILAANIIVIGYFVFKDPVRNSFRVKKKSAILEESVVNQLADSVMAAVNDSTMMLSEGPSVPMLEEVQGEMTGNFRYYIVAGCFRDEINADELVGSLKNMGYKAEKFGKIGDLFAVSFASFDNKELAVKELARIRKEFHPDAWMTRF